MAFSFLTSLFSRKRPDKDEEVRLALMDEAHRHPEVLATHERRSLLVTAVKAQQSAIVNAQRSAIVKAGGGAPLDAMMAELERLTRAAQLAQKAYEQAVEKAVDQVWKRYREAVASGQPWESILTPVKVCRGSVCRFEVERQDSPEPVADSPNQNQAQGTATIKQGGTS